jgi:4-carboxymuconolactone decarboxylase
MIIDHEERRRAGLAAYEQIMGVAHPDPDSPRAAALIDFVYAEIWTRPGLTRRERRLIALSCLAGADSLQPLGDHIYGALASGDLSVAELDEWVLHFAVYCGWGKAEVVEHVLDEQRARLAADRGESAPRRNPQPVSPVSRDQDARKQRGEQEFRDVNVAPSPPRGVPYYDDGILNFVFGDMWLRSGLSRRDRRWITLACVGLDDTVVPVRSHVYSAMKTGDCSFEEMRELVLQFAAYSGWPKASFLQQAVDEEHARILREAAEPE